MTEEKPDLETPQSTPKTGETEQQPSIFDKVKARLGGVTPEDLTELRTENETLKAEIANLKEDLELEKAEAQKGRELAEVVAQLTEEKETLEAEQKTVSQAAAEIAASAHIPVSKLPKIGQSEKPALPTDRASLEAALDECETMQERLELKRAYDKRHQN